MVRNIFETVKAPKNKGMTPARLKALRQGFADGGEIIIGGADETVPRPRADVVDALLFLGFLKCPVGSRCDIYGFTEKAFQFCRSEKGQSCQ